MTIWESGRESALLDEIIAGRKTIEGRLNRSKFAQYKPGDQVWLRRDYRDEYGVLQEGELRQVLIEVIAIRKHDTFFDMVTAEEFIKIIPNAKSAEEAAREYDLYYTAEDQAKYGVLAIEPKVLMYA